tara:strand:- start:33 stop:221 length:189 start_codon:yes stop_codon:yes gene_type:complete
MILINTYTVMKTILIIIAVYLFTKYGTFNSTQLKKDVTNITKGDVESWKKVNKEYDKYKERS